MSKVNLIADQDVSALLDADFVQEQIQADVYITFACVEPNDRADDEWVGEDGKQSFLISLPYQKVKKMTKDKVKELMLTKAKERLLQAA